jgi:hypothetical protein
VSRAGRAHARARQWDTVFAGSSKTSYASFGADPDFLLLQSALAAMKATTPSPDVIFISGDLLVHRLNQLYPAALPASTPAETAAFAQKTEQYLAFKLTQTFPDAQIVATMGDWDSDVDIHSFPSAAFISSFAATWGPAANRLGGAPTMQATFPQALFPTQASGPPHRRKPAGVDPRAAASQPSGGRTDGTSCASRGSRPLPSTRRQGPPPTAAPFTPRHVRQRNLCHS